MRGPRRMGRRRRLDHLAGARDDAQRRDHVLDLAVPARILTRTARREVSADGGAVERRRVVSERQPAPLQLDLHVHPHDAALHPHRHVVDIRLDDRFEPLQVDDHAVAIGERAATHAATGAVRHDRRARAPRPLDHAEHLVFRTRLHDRTRLMPLQPSSPRQDDAARPTVRVVREPVRQARQHGFVAHDRRQLAPQRL